MWTTTTQNAVFLEFVAGCCRVFCVVLHGGCVPLHGQGDVSILFRRDAAVFREQRYFAIGDRVGFLLTVALNT